MRQGRRPRAASAVREPYFLPVGEAEAAPSLLGHADRAALERCHARTDRAELWALARRLDACDRPPPVAAGGFGADLDFARVTHDRDVVGARHEVRPAVEWI